MSGNSIKKNKNFENAEGPMLNQLFTNPVFNNLGEIGECKFILPLHFVNVNEEINKLIVHDDDVFVIGHPKSGTTWLNEMVFLIINNLDYELGKTFIKEHIHILEKSLLYDKEMEVNYHSCEFISKLPSPRCIRTHLCWSLLPEQIRNDETQHKIIYIYRNPMDTCISYYNFCVMLYGFVGELEDFCKLFMSGKLLYGPYFEALLSYWNERERKNILFLNYKDMKEDLPGVIKKVAKYLNKSYTDEEINKLGEYLSFGATKNRSEQNMLKRLEPIIKLNKTTPVVGPSFYRTGKEGNYRSVMSSELISKFEVWIEHNISGTGFVF